MTALAQASIPHRLKQAIDSLNLFVRADQWWTYKIPLALTVAYSTAVSKGMPLELIWRPLLLLVLCGVSAAVYASILDDVCDVSEDRAAGKHTAVTSLSTSTHRVLILAIAAMTGATMFLLRDLPFSLLVYATVCLSFALYSVPPCRLKQRHAWGMLCIAAGEHTLPALFAIALVCESTGASVSLQWLAAVCLWTSAYGCRGILWHQLTDYENDLRSNTCTVAVKYGPGATKVLGESVMLPLELAALAGFLFINNNALSWLLFFLYIILESSRKRYQGLDIVFVSPSTKSFRFALVEFYQLILPLSFLLAATAANIQWGLIAAVHVAFFPAPAVQCARQIKFICTSLLRSILQRSSMPYADK